MFNKEDRQLFDTMHQQLQKDMSNMTLPNAPQRSWFGTIFKLWLSFGVIGTVLGVAFWGTIGYVVFHFVSKWW